MKFFSKLIFVLSIFALAGVMKAQDNSTTDTDDRVVGNLVILDSQTYSGGVSLAWNYANTPAVTSDMYTRMLSDGTYAQQIDDQYNPYDHSTVTNYLVNSFGQYLVTLPILYPGQGNWDVLARAAPGSDIGFGKRSYNIYDSYDAGSTLITKEAEWSTYEIYFYKRISKGPYELVTQLINVPDINWNRVTSLYQAYLDKKYTGAPGYDEAKAKGELAFTITIKSPLAKSQLPAEVDYGYNLHINAQVMKGYTDWIGNDLDKQIGIKVSDDGHGNLSSQISVLRLEVDHTLTN